MTAKIPPPRRQSASFLLTQVGAHAAARFAERLAPLGYSPPQAGILRVLDSSAGVSQQRLAATLRIDPSRLVAIIDELESRGLVERGESDADRRSYALRLTAKGKAALTDIGRVAREHDAAVCAALDERERGVLAELLARVADQQGLTPNVHPGFSLLGPRRTDDT